MREIRDIPKNAVVRVKAIAARQGLDLDEEESDRMIFSTRENGDMESDRPGAADVRRALAAQNQIRHEFPKLDVEVSTMDEWTTLVVRGETVVAV